MDMKDCEVRQPYDFRINSSVGVLRGYRPYLIPR